MQFSERSIDRTVRRSESRGGTPRPKRSLADSLWLAYGLWGIAAALAIAIKCFEDGVAILNLPMWAWALGGGFWFVSGASYLGIPSGKVRAEVRVANTVALIFTVAALLTTVMVGAMSDATQQDRFAQMLRSVATFTIWISIVVTPGLAGAFTFFSMLELRARARPQP